MNDPRLLDGVLVQWGERLFYPGNRRVPAAPGGAGIGLRARAATVRQRIERTVARAPQVMVKVTGGGRGMVAIAAHLRYISKNGRIPMEDDRGNQREGREALLDVAGQWRLGGSRIPEKSERREAFNIMLSMPRGTNPLIVQRAAREFAQTELANHRYVMVLHDHQANPHVHLSVRAEGRDGQRLNPRKEDLRRWRETFAERLRGWGVEAEATSQVTRGTRHRNERVWERKTGLSREKRQERAEALPSGMKRQALQGWAEIMSALAASPEESDRQLAQSIGQYLGRLPAVQAMVRYQAQQRELPGIDRSPLTMPSQERRGPEMER